MRCVVSVATGPHYVENLDRLMASEFMMPPYFKAGCQKMYWRDSLPDGSPMHDSVPYGFKYAAIEEALTRGASSILWLDSSTIILKPLDPIWELIESQGYWFSRNYDYTNGQFCSDEANAIMGTSREAAFGVPHCVASCFGLDMRSKIATVFMAAWKDWAQQGAFKGDRGNLSGVSDAHTYQGHRNDQAVASQIIADLGMKMTDPPDYFAEQGAPRNERTILTLER